MRLQHLWQGLLDLIYPPRETCPFCETRSPHTALCGQCIEWLNEYGTGAVCEVCGRFMTLPGGVSPGQGESHICNLCLIDRPPFTCARAVAPYHGILREAILRLKFKKSQNLVAALGRLMADVARRQRGFLSSDMIIPVPLSPKRRAKRGYNQAELLAEELGNILALPVEKKLLIKTRETKPQSELSRQEREINLVKAFEVVDCGKIWGKRLLVVDDVLTTGATVVNITTKLQQFNPSGVFILTAAGSIVTGKTDKTYQIAIKFRQKQSCF